MSNKDFTLTESISESISEDTKALLDKAIKTKESNGPRIEDGKTLADLKNAIANLKSASEIKSESQSNKSSKIEKTINILEHIETIIRLIAPHFENSRERVKAENKIRQFASSLVKK